MLLPEKAREAILRQLEGNQLGFLSRFVGERNSGVRVFQTMDFFFFLNICPESP